MGSTNLIAIFVSKLMCNFVFMNFYLITNDFCCKTNYKKYQTWLHLYFEGYFRTNELFSLKISLFLQLFFKLVIISWSYCVKMRLSTSQVFCQKTIDLMWPFVSEKSGMQLPCFGKVTLSVPTTSACSPRDKSHVIVTGLY